MKSKYLLIVTLLISLLFPTIVVGYVWGDTATVVTPSSYGVTLDFPLWSGAIDYFAQSPYIQSINVSYGEYSFMGTTEIYFVDELDPNDYVLLSYELAMLSRAYHNDVASWWWASAFPVEQTYYMLPSGVVSICKPHFVPQLGYRVLRCT